MIQSLSIAHFKAFREVQAESLGRINVFVGRNNVGKSTVLHALELVGLAASWNDWSRFPLKLNVKDLLWDKGDLSLTLFLETGSLVNVTARDRQTPVVELGGASREELRSVLILPDGGESYLRRGAVTPAEAIQQVTAGDFSRVNALDILHMIKFYGTKEQRGFSPQSYDALVSEIKGFFPELRDVRSELTENYHSTLEYREDGPVLDILYSGTGLKRFIDILIKVSLSKAPIVLLDEPEFGMHPDLQRRMLNFLSDLAQKKNLQFFLATHSPVFVNEEAGTVLFRIRSGQNGRSIERISEEARHTVLADLGLRPSDLFQNDICVMVEGADDVAIFEYVLHDLYKQEFAGIAVGVVQYGGGAGEAITTGKVSVANIAGSQHFLHWIRDRDARPVDPPSNQAQAFANALSQAGQSVTILSKREIEYYVPAQVYADAQGNDLAKQSHALTIVDGDQSEKLRNAFGAFGCTIPRGPKLRKGLEAHLSRANLDPELRTIIETILIPWSAELRGAPAA